MEFERDQGPTSLIPQQLENTRVLDLPLGFHFDPRDDELINHHLKKKLDNQPIPFDIICSVDVYKYDPQELTGYYPSLGENEWYFFTPRDRKHPNGNRPNRTAVNGYWKATAADKRIYDNVNGCVIGFKKTLVFYQGKSPKGLKTDWSMHEYVVADQPSRQRIMISSENMRLDNCVLCRIYKRPKYERHNMIPGECNLLVQQTQQNNSNLPSDPGVDVQLNNFWNIESELGNFIGLISHDMVDLGPLLSDDFNNLPGPEMNDFGLGLPSLLDNIDNLQEPFSYSLFPGSN